MWIGLYFKHIGVSIRRKPLQPLLSVLILALACILSSFALNVSGWLKAEKEEAQKAQYGRSVVEVTLNGNSENRFLMADDVYAAIEASDDDTLFSDDVAVTGTYELPLYYGDGFAFAVATDFETVGGVFDLTFTSYGVVTDKTVNETVFLSENFAKKYDLSVGNALQAEVLGHKVKYTVQGISSEKFMGNYDVLLPIGSVVRALATDFPYLATLGDDFQIYSTLFVSTDKTEAEAIANALKAYPAFADKTVTITSNILLSRINLQQVEILVKVLVIFVNLLALAVVSCCFYILSAERAEENGLFALAGVSPEKLLLLQCSEIIFYAVLGDILGVGICCLIAPTIVQLCGFQYISAFIPTFFSRCAVGAGATLLAALLTAICMAGGHFAKQKKHGRANQKNTAMTAVFALGTAVFFLCSLFTPVSLHRIFATICMLFFAGLLFFGVPTLFCAVMQRVANGKKRLGRKVLACTKTDGKVPKRSEKLGHAPRLGLRYALKNARNVKTLHNSCRLTALLVAVALSMAMVLASGENYVDALYAVFPSDYMVMNVSESAVAEIQSANGVETVYSVCWKSGSVGETDSVELFAANDLSAFAEPFRPSELPTGQNAVTTVAYAKCLGLSVGDEWSVTVDGKELTFTLSEVISSPLNYIYFDAVSMGIPYNILSVTGQEGVSMSELRGEIASAMSLEMPLIVSVSEFMETKISAFDIYNRCGDFLFFALLFFALTGLIDNLFESYRSRKDEFLLYQNCGMTNRGIARMKAWEIGITLSFALPLGIVGGAGLILILHQWMQPFSVDLLALIFFRI
jgi:hypothetical protein